MSRYKLARRIGHRGAFLLFLVLLDLLYGYSILSDPHPYAALTSLGAAQVIGWAWVSVGVILATGIAITKDKFHYALAALAKAAWAGFWLRATVFEHVTRGWPTVVIWFAFAALVLVVSSWPEQPTITVQLPKDTTIRPADITKNIKRGDVE